MDIPIILAVLVTAGVTGVGVAVYLLIRSKIDGNQVENAKELAKGVLTQAEEEKKKYPLIGTGRSPKSPYRGREGHQRTKARAQPPRT